MEYSLVEVFNTLLIAGDAVMRTLRPREDQVGDLPPAEAHPGGKLNFHVVGLLENGTKVKVKLLHIIRFYSI